MSNKSNSTYQRKNGVVMKQINLAVREDIAEKFDRLRDGLSKSTIFTQWVIEKESKYLLKIYSHDDQTTLKEVNIPKEYPSYSILNGEDNNN